jgi:hypothetical protein
MTTSNSISENAISFYASGGHAHDGVTSSLIKTNAYSIYDFNPSFIGDNPERRRAQVNNYNSFRQLVVNTINSTVLEPAGIVLQDNIINSRNIISGSITATEIAANTITADNIAAGAITANELAANIVLVNNYITSGNFDGTIAANGAVTSAGTAGWAVTSFGHAVFDTTFIRGSLSASEVLTPGVDIYSNGTLAANAFTLYGNGAIVAANGNFNVNASGILSATGANISGTINSTNGSIGGFSLGTNDIDGGGVLLHTSVGPGDPSYLIAQDVIGTFAAIYSDGSIQLQNAAIGASQSMNGGSYSVTDSLGRTTSVQGSGIYGSLGYIGTNGISSTGPIYTGLSYLSSGDIYSTNVISADGAMFSPYFVMSGTVTGVGSALIRRSDGYILISSSRRELKSNIEDISNSLSRIEALRPRIFNWKPQPDDPDDIFHREIKANHRTMGFVVEEVADISPEYLEYSIKSDGQLDGHYWKAHDFIALAIQGIKDLSAKVTSLEQRIAQLEG